MHSLRLRLYVLVSLVLAVPGCGPNSTPVSNTSNSRASQPSMSAFDSGDADVKSSAITTSALKPKAEDPIEEIFDNAVEELISKK